MIKITQALNPMWVALPFAVLTRTHSAILCFCAVLLHQTYPNFLHGLLQSCVEQMLAIKLLFCWRSSCIQSFCHELDFFKYCKNSHTSNVHFQTDISIFLCLKGFTTFIYFPMAQIYYSWWLQTTS